MKSFLTFTLAAGVAITGAQVVHAAGVPKSPVSVVKSPVLAPAPANRMNGTSTFDRTALNRELARISDLVMPMGLDDSSADDQTGRSVGKKGIGGFTY